MDDIRHKKVKTDMDSTATALDSDTVLLLMQAEIEQLAGMIQTQSRQLELIWERLNAMSKNHPEAG